MPMKLLDRIASRFGYTKTVTLADLWKRGEDIRDWRDHIYQGSGSSVFQVPAVFACVRVLAESVASLPLILYKRLPDGGKERATKHPLYNILHNQPNKQQTSFEFREMMQSHLALRGNGVAEIVRDVRGHVKSIVPLKPDNVKIEGLSNGVLIYTVRDDKGEARTLTQHDLFHVRGLATDGFWGMSPIAVARGAISLSRNAEQYGQNIFKSGGTKRLVLHHPGVLKPETAQRLLEQWEGQYSGNAKTAILEEGMTAETVGMSAEDAQFLETRKFQIQEIARIFRVPPHMIGDLEKATFSNIEHQSLEFVIHTMRPWLVRWEQAITRDLIKEKDKYFAEFLVDALLRGDTKSRTEALKTRFMNGAINLDEWRAIENRNPLPDGLGQIHYVPLNLVEVGAEPEPEPEPKPEPEDGVEPDAVESNFINLFIKDAVERIVNAELNEIGKHVKHASEDLGRFRIWVSNYFNQHKAFVEKAMAPLCEASNMNGQTYELVHTIAVIPLSKWITDEDPQALFERWKDKRKEYVENVIQASLEKNETNGLARKVQAAAAWNRLSCIPEDYAEADQRS